MSAPSSKISPSDAVSKPDKILSRVVLPHPEGPRMVTNSPFLICKLTSSSTCLSPNHLDTCLISMMLPPGSTLLSANAVLYYKVIQHKNVKLSQIWGEDTTKLQLYKINGSFFSFTVVKGARHSRSPCSFKASPSATMPSTALSLPVPPAPRPRRHIASSCRVVYSGR